MIPNNFESQNKFTCKIATQGYFKEFEHQDGSLLGVVNQVIPLRSQLNSLKKLHSFSSLFLHWFGW